jgi:hypothetical protein
VEEQVPNMKYCEYKNEGYVPKTLEKAEKAVIVMPKFYVEQNEGHHPVTGRPQLYYMWTHPLAKEKKLGIQIVLVKIIFHAVYLFLII